jgi:hypothetical protein
VTVATTTAIARTAHQCPRTNRRMPILPRCQPGCDHGSLRRILTHEMLPFKSSLKLRSHLKRFMAGHRKGWTNCGGVSASAVRNLIQLQTLGPVTLASATGHNRLYATRQRATQRRPFISLGSYGQSKYANRSRMMVHQKSLDKKGRLRANVSHFDPLRRSPKIPPSPSQPKS